MLRELLNDATYRLRALFRRSRLEQDLADEMRDHLEREAERYAREGLSRQAAIRRARVEFGGVEDVKESAREARGVAWVEHLAQDTRYALRMLARNPAYATAAILSLALGIGANTAIFSALDALLLRPLPVEHPSQVTTFELSYDDGYRQYNLGFPDYRAIQDLKGIVAGATATSWAESFDVKSADADLTLQGGPAHISVVTGNYFTVLGLHPQRGRLFADEDDGDDMGAHPVAVISDGYWQRVFGRAPSIIGRIVRINGTAFTVVGVTPRPFTGDWIGWPTDFWVPSSMVSALHPESAGRPRYNYQFKILARLAPGVSIETAQAAVDLLYSRMLRDPQPGSGIGPKARLVVRSAATGYSPQREAFGRPLAVLMVIVGAVLFIACANMANLQLARAVGRQREIGMRLALGADRGRVVRQLMTESVILALLGGVVGLVLATGAMSILGTLARSGPVGGIATSSNPLSVEMTLRLDPRVLGFAFALCLLTSIVFGLFPAFRGSRVALLPSLGSAGARISDFAGPAIRSILVVAQVALSVLLVVGTGLFVRTLRNLETQQLGYQREHLLLVWALPGHTGRTGDQIRALWPQIQNSLTAVPGVASAGVSVEGLLPGGPASGPLISSVGDGGADTVRVGQTMTVSPEFFSTIGQRMRSGRDFTAFDTDSAPRVVIVNETLARRLFGPNRSAVGQRVAMRGQPTPYDIIGVVADARQTVRTAVGPALYYPPGQNVRRLSRGMGIVVRTMGNPVGATNAIREALRGVDPNLPVLSIDTIDKQLSRILFQERLIASLSVGFAALAVLMSCVGLYGVVAYVTARRTQEIGIRMALGASRSGVLASVLRDSVRLALIGTGVGVVAALGTTRAVSSLLFGVSPTDPTTMAGASALIVVVAAMAGFFPAHRASRVNPVVALRSD